MTQDTIFFEQPLNECMRACLRLEHLFDLISININGASGEESRRALESMLEALNVIDRPDLKTKITQALSQHANSLQQLEERSNVNHQKLRAILLELTHIIEALNKIQDKMGYQLRNNNFLTTIRQHMANPAGACAFSTPAYYLWLRQSAEQRIQNLHAWYAEFKQPQQAVKLLLRLTRGSAHPLQLTALRGFYQQALDAKLAYHLVRVMVSLQPKVYPEISIGKHRLSVRFLELNTQDKPLQTLADIPFELTCCMPLGSGL